MVVDQNQTIGDFIQSIMNAIMPVAKEFGWLLILVAVVMVGFEVIKHRNDDEKRKNALISLLWLAVGAFIIGSAVVIANLIWNGTGHLG